MKSKQEVYSVNSPVHAESETKKQSDQLSKLGCTVNTENNDTANICHVKF